MQTRPRCYLSPGISPAAWNPRTPGKPPEHNVEHVIETEGQPLYARPRHLDQVKLPQAKAEFQKLESAGIIIPAGLIVLGPHLYIWFKNLMDPGVLAAITSV